jgi:hypothetical protein
MPDNQISELKNSLTDDNITNSGFKEKFICPNLYKCLRRQDLYSYFQEKLGRCLFTLITLNV